MKTAYLDCASGVSGDMLLGALVDAGVSLETLGATIDSLGLPDCRLTAEQVRRAGLRATLVKVDVPTEKTARHLPEILRIIDGGGLTDDQKERAARIFHRLAEAEARAHGTDVDKIHFHELGALDTIVDIVGAVVGFDLLGVERVVASPIPTGWGTIKIAHGTVSLPAPAVAELLRGVPLAESNIEAELTTPTGAVLVTTFADSFGPPPAMTLETIGCGAGCKDFAEQPNLLRLLIGRAADTQAAETDTVWLLETNLDNATGEAIGHCIERLRKAGSLDVWTTPIQMKKQRPGVMLSVLARADEVDDAETILFTETPTLGVRRRPIQRRILQRKPCEVTTPWGAVAGKIRVLPDGTERFTPEYESCREVAQREGVALQDVYKAANRAFTP